MILGRIIWNISESVCDELSSSFVSQVDVITDGGKGYTFGNIFSVYVAKLCR
jgi:hypothetical protein